MRFAVALDGSTVSQHFGHCERFLIIDAEDGKVNDQKYLANPAHQPGFLPAYLSEQGVACIIAGGMGPRAQQLFGQQGIQVLAGVAGTADQVVEDFLAEKLAIGPNACDH